MRDTAFLETALREANDLHASLVRRAKSEEDLVAIASVFAEEAAAVYRAMGGGRMVAAQFYRIADNAAVEPAGSQRR